MDKLYYYNGFGITPTNTHISAGTDFYIPLIKTEEEIAVALKAFEKSYGKPEYKLEKLLSDIKYWTGKEDKATLVNILHLYLALQSYDVEEEELSVHGNPVRYFVAQYLTYDKNGVPGIIIKKDDTLFINSGIKVNLNLNTCGLYVNKSGMGNKGFDVRAQLVDEDYAGYVHLSLAYTKHTHKLQSVFCGDKVTQMMVFEIRHNEWKSITEEEYNDKMQNSERGDLGFGSSDVKH